MTEEKKPLLIQIDDEVREMTPEEVINYEALTAHAVALSSTDPE
jgi:hypothetical protein